MKLVKSTILYKNKESKICTVHVYCNVSISLNNYDYINILADKLRINNGQNI